MKISPATTKKAPILGLFPFLSCVKNGHFRGLMTKLRQLEIAALGMIEPPSRFLDECAFRQGHYNSREKPIFTRFNGKYVLINTLFNTFCFPVFAQSNFSHILFYTRNKHPPAKPVVFHMRAKPSVPRARVKRVSTICQLRRTVTCRP